MFSTRSLTRHPRTVTLAVFMAMALLYQLGTGLLGADASVFSADSPDGYAEFWVPHSEFTGGIVGVDEPGYDPADPCQAADPGGTWYLEPEPGCPKTVSITLPDISGATGAEIYLDIWRGRDNRMVRYSLNGNPAVQAQGGADWSRTPVVETIPLSELQTGTNTITFTTYGAYHIHDIALRIHGLGGTYPSGSLDTVGGVAAGTVASVDVTGSEQITVTATVADADLVEFIAYYDGFDENNDGETTDWHAFTRNNFHPGGLPPGTTIPATGGTIGNIGTDVNDGDDTYSVVWDTSLVPAQSGVRIKARAVRHGSGTRNDVTEAVGGTSATFDLVRTDALVEVFTVPGFEDAVIHHGGSMPDSLDRSIELPTDQGDWISATMVANYWNNPYVSLNANTAFKAFTSGEDWWSTSVRTVPLGDLQPGTNTITYSYNSAGGSFGQFVEQPGPMLVVRRGGAPRVDTDPQDQVAVDGQTVQFSVVASALDPSYQWYADGVPVGTDSPTLTVVASAADPAVDYTVAVTAQGSTVTSGTATLTVVPDAVVSDDFSDPVASQALWTQEDALGDSTFTWTGAQAFLSVPESGVSHEPWTSGQMAAALLQPVSDVDLNVVAAFDTRPESRYQLQGVLVEDSAGRFLRFDVFHDGSQLNAFAAYLDGASATTRVAATAVPVTEGNFIRVTRVGDTWSLFTSADGVAWTQRGASFTQALTVSRLGPYGGNALAGGGLDAPDHHVAVDYFGALPIPAEADSDTTSPTITDVAVVPSATGMVVSWSTSEPTTGSVDYGQGGSYSEGTVDSPSLHLAHSVTIGGLQPDTSYSLRVNAVDVNSNGSAITTSSGTQSAGSGDTLFQFFYGGQQSFGALGEPQRWVNILGNASDPQGLSTLEYRLNGGAWTTMGIGANGRRLVAAGDFNVDLAASDLQTGGNTVEIRATDATSDVTTTSVQVNWTPGVDWSLPYGVTWSGVSDLTTAAQVVDGNWSLSTDGLEVQNVDTGYDRLLAFGETTWSDYEVLVPITVNAIGAGADDSPSNGPGIGVILRWNGHNDTVTPGSQPLQGFLPDGVDPTPLGALAWWRRPVGGTEGLQITDHRAALVQNVPSFTLDVGTEYMLRARVVTSGPNSVYSVKMWPASGSEPSGWMATYTAGTDDDQPESGSLVLVSHEVDATFGDLIVTPAGSTTAAAPQVSPSGPYIDSDQQVSMTAGSAGAVIHYTTDGSTPTPLSPTYSGPFTLASDSTVRAVAYETGKDPSAVTSLDLLVNQAPSVSAGAGVTVDLGQAADLSGSATDDGRPGPLTTTWSVDSGPGEVSFADASAPSTTAVFSEAGTYVLALTADDGSMTDRDQVTVTVNESAIPSGYWVANSNGEVYAFGDVPVLADITAQTATSPLAAIEADRTRKGYWLAQQNGAVTAFGDAPAIGDLPSLGVVPAFPIVDMAATASGEGYFLLGSDGGIFTFGDAAFRGSTGDIVLDQPVVAMAANPVGDGYWFVARDGGIFTYGTDTRFQGSLPAIVPFAQLAAPVVGMAATATGEGYWLVASDGGIFTFGDAAFHGSIPGVLAPGQSLNSPIVGMVATSSGNGYWLVAADGGVFGFGDAVFLGSIAGQVSGGEIVDLAN